MLRETKYNTTLKIFETVFYGDVGMNELIEMMKTLARLSQTYACYKSLVDFSNSKLMLCTKEVDSLPMLINEICLPIKTNMDKIKRALIVNKIVENSTDVFYRMVKLKDGSLFKVFYDRPAAIRWLMME